MRRAALLQGLCMVIALTAVTPVGRASAEGNRLLPFWAQPFPYGYAYRSAERAAPEPCALSRRPRRAPVLRRCLVTLHARD